MADQWSNLRTNVAGALLGWKRREARDGVVLTLQIVQQAGAEHHLHRVKVSLSDNQLRSMARDLADIAKDRGLAVGSKKPLHERLWRRMKALRK